MKKIVSTISLAILSLISQAGIESIKINGIATTPLKDWNNIDPKTKLGYGAEIMFSNNRTSSIQYGFNAEIMYSNTSDYTVPVFVNKTPSTGNLTVKNINYDFGGKFRINPMTTKLRPYIDLNAGISTFTSNTTVQTTFSYFDNEEQLIDKTIETNKERMIDGANFYVGWGIGLNYALTNNILINIQGSRNYTTEGRYMNSESISVTEKGAVDYSLNQSRTSNFKTSAGLIFKF